MRLNKHSQCSFERTHVSCLHRAFKWTQNDVYTHDKWCTNPKMENTNVSRSATMRLAGLSNNSFVDIERKRGSTLVSYSTLPWKFVRISVYKSEIDVIWIDGPSTSLTLQFVRPVFSKRYIRSLNQTRSHGFLFRLFKVNFGSNFT